MIGHFSDGMIYVEGPIAPPIKIKKHELNDNNFYIYIIQQCDICNEKSQASDNT